MQKVQRLINTFVPSHYDLTLDIDRPNRNFKGKVTITGSTPNDQQKVSLHSKDLDINLVTINGIKTSFSFDENDALVLDYSTKDKNLVIDIDFNGKINDHMHGMYPCYYNHNGDKKELIATQFESHHAREVFPCVDEPEAKASFDLTLITEKNVTVLGNMPIKTSGDSGEKSITKFDTTPVMSTYLLAWVIGDLHKKTAHTKSGVEVNVWATVAQDAADFDFALDIATRSIDYFDEYYGIPYPLPKCDHVALPDFSSGAMENWGLITYREVLLLENSKTTSIGSRHHIALVVAHELSHQWFGNLVTMKWWNDLWLNESFATLVEYMAIDALQPDWNIWLDFASGECIYALRRDRLDGVQSVQTDVNHPDEISTLFDGAIVYAKGARLLKMLRRYIGDEAFRNGLRLYFKKHAYKNTEASDLWAALSESSGKDIAKFMTLWISQPGFPVLNVTTSDDSMTLSQNRIFDSGNNAHNWPIPLMSNDKDLPELIDMSVQSVKTSAKNVRFNIGNDAHYVTNYSDDLIKNITDELAQNKLDVIDRLQVLNEAIILAQSGIISNARIVELIQYYENEDREAVWDIIGLAISELKKFVNQEDDLEQRLKLLSKKLAAKQYDRLGWLAKTNEPDEDAKLRAHAIGLTLYSDDTHAIEQAKRLYEKTSVENLNPELRTLILSTVVKHEQDGTVSDSLFDIYKKSESAELKQDICAGLTGTKSPVVAQKLLDTVKDTKIIRTQDTHMWIIYLVRNKYTRDITWQWIRDNWEWIEKTFGGDKGYGDYPRYIASALSTQKQLDEYQTFYAPLSEKPALSRNINMGIKEITERVQIIEHDGAAVRDALDRIQT